MTHAELRAALRQLGLTQAEFAHICGVSGRAVQRWVQDDGPSARGVSPQAARVAGWLLAGFRPPEWPQG